MYTLIIYFPFHHGSLSDKTISVYDHQNLAQMHFKGIEQITMLNNSFLCAFALILLGWRAVRILACTLGSTGVLLSIDIALSINLFECFAAIASALLAFFCTMHTIYTLIC